MQDRQEYKSYTIRSTDPASMVEEEDASVFGWLVGAEVGLGVVGLGVGRPGHPLGQAEQ